MERNKNIDHLVEETLDSASSIQEAKTPPFFKDKVLRKVSQTTIEKEDGVPYVNWLTPAYQIAILIILVVINAIALFSTTKEPSYVENVEDFAKTYGILEPDMDTYFYQD